MLNLSTRFRLIPMLAVAGSLCWHVAVSAAVIEIKDYVVSVGKRADYFDGKLLTTGDLSGDQEYKKGTSTLLGDPAQVLGDSTLTFPALDASGFSPKANS
jgi:hypothetical protein